MILAFCMIFRGQTYSFRHYEVESGLTNNAVICSAQDHNGFMWFGTRDGLNRFDGYYFKTYRFPETQIHFIYVDPSGTLLVSTQKSIYKYNPISDTFKLCLTYGYYIEEILSDSKGNIWFNANDELCRFSEKNKKLKKFPKNQFFHASGLGIDQQGIVWICSPSGLLQKYNSNTETFTTFNLFAHSKKVRSSVTSAIKCTRNGKILIGTDHFGLKIFDIKSNSYKDIDLCCEKFSDLFFRCFLEVSDNELWIGTETGIFKYNYQTGVSSKIEKNVSDDYSISDNVIYSLCKDSEGGVWVGTYFGGINYYPKQYTPFEKFYQHSAYKSLSGNIVRELTEDHIGNLWIGTEDGGLNKLDAKTGQMQYYKPDNTKYSLSYICAHSLQAVDNELWVGTYNKGLDIIDINTGKVIRHYDESSTGGFNPSFPFTFLRIDNKIIIAAYPGLYQYDLVTKIFSFFPHFPSGALYQCLLKDTHGNIWASAYGKGVMFYNEQSSIFKKFTHFADNEKSLSSDMVTDIFEDSKKDLWFATENGLCKLNKDKKNFRRYGTAEGFPSNFMLSILEDLKGRLWISTTKGLVCFDTQKDSVSSIYTTANGLLSDQFNFSSAYKDKQNRLYFGSAKGLVRFNPENFIVDTFIPPVFITDMRINGKEINTKNKDNPLKQSILYTDKITLRHEQSTFSIDFAALGYTAPQDLKYAYKLEGLSNNWTYIKGERRANFTKLQPGIYIFKVKAASTAGIWNNKETVIKIEILPAWWASSWALFLYLLFSFLILYLSLQFYHKTTQEKNKRAIERLEIAREKEILKIEIAKEKEILESKVEFYTQVAHEIRTPLTLIKIPLGKVIRKTEGMEEIKNSLKIMDGNTDRLIELSNQLLDFRQTEIKAYSFSFQRTNISDLLENAYQNFAELAEQNNIKFVLESPKEKLFAYVDVDAFTKIIYNLLGNALKYAATSVTIILKPSSPSLYHFTILLKNDGYIIPDSLGEKIFEPFFRIKETDAKTGSGIGLALARSITLAHNGTLIFENEDNKMNIFSLTLHINNKDI